MSLLSTLTEKTTSFVFKTSEQPMLFKELMQANKIYNDRMNLEYNMKGFRIRLGRLYLVFFFLAIVIATPVSFLLHTLLAKIDCHALILMSVAFTVIFFSAFALFKSWLIEKISKKLILEAWNNHFPHFDYKNNREKVSHIYEEALENGIKNKDLKHHVITKMVG